MTKLLDREVDEELKKSFIAYAMAVNVSRAIPAAVDRTEVAVPVDEWEVYGKVLRKPDERIVNRARSRQTVLAFNGRTARAEKTVHRRQRKTR